MQLGTLLSDLILLTSKVKWTFLSGNLQITIENSSEQKGMRIFTRFTHFKCSASHVTYVSCYIFFIP